MFSLLSSGSVKKSEVSELRQQLQSLNSETQSSAMAKVLYQGLQGVHLDCLFADVLKCGHTDNYKLKKMVYVYLSSTACRQPELAMLTVNTLARDFQSPSPLVRTLSLRTAVNMGVPGLWEHLGQHFQDCLKDEDPYVRKSTVLSIVSLCKKSPQWADEMGFIATVTKLLHDSNACVVVNAVAALAELEQLSLTGKLVMKLLTVLQESHEWGRVTILEAVSSYVPSSPFEALCICDRVTQYLSHANPAVVLTTLKVLIPLIELLPTELDKTENKSKLGSPIKTLLNCQPAIQYVALRNIQIILQKYPDVVGNDVRAFFIRYQDPIFVKLEKLSVIVKLANSSNMFEVIGELYEYSGEVDIAFVKKSVLAIGQCAHKNETMADLCVKTLLKLVETNVPYIVETVIIAFRDIFRRYPNKYEQAINRFSERFERIDDCEARCSFIWMLGEYVSYITDAEDLLARFMEDFSEEVPMVQQALLTAIVKTFLVMGNNSELIYDVLKKAVDVSNPDLRDRAYIYWRLLSTDPGAAKQIVLAEKMPILYCENVVEPSLLDGFLKEVGMLKSVVF